MAADPTVMFCVGATKAGTSWLYSYVQGHPDCAVRSVKELHYFDTVDFGQSHYVDGLRQQRSRIAARQKVESAKADELDTRIADIDELLSVLEQGAGGEAAYLAYLTRGADGARLVADLTPAYALLSEERLSRMAAMAPETRFVFLMRDPVARLWSHVRMIAKRRLATGDDVAVRARNILRRCLQGGEAHILDRGDYASIVEKLRAAIPQDKLHIAFYEDITAGQGVDMLCDFLGIARVPARTETRVHEGVAIAMTEGQRAEAAAFLAPQYRYVSDLTGRLPAAWQAHMQGSEI